MKPSPTTIEPSWAAWIAENLLRGAPPVDLVSVLVAQGLDEADAIQAVRRIETSPILAAAQRLVRRSAGVEQAARLARTVQGVATFEVTHLDDDSFFAGWFSAHRPVVFRGAALQWPAMAWTHRDLASAYGDVEVQVLSGRSAHARWWMVRDEISVRVPFAQLLQACLGPSSDDVYAVGRNDLLAEPGLAPLLDQIRPLPGCGPDLRPRLWVGPQGTRTPLHHDQSSAWLVQLEGTKRVWLASPLEPSLLDTAHGVFNDLDPREPAEGDAGEVRWWQADLAPGDAVFLPVGWWHQVVAMSPSISVSLGGFQWQHGHSWYHPGRKLQNTTALV